MCKGDDDNTCMIFDCDEPRHKQMLCFQHYCYHYGPPITSFESAAGFIAWGLSEGVSNG